MSTIADSQTSLSNIKSTNVKYGSIHQWQYPSSPTVKTTHRPAEQFTDSCYSKLAAGQEQNRVYTALVLPLISDLLCTKCRNWCQCKSGVSG